MTEKWSEPGRNPHALRARVLRGTSWKLGSQIVVQVGRIGFVLILARLLSPTDFGLVAMALVVTGFVIAFSDLGLGAALVQRHSIDERDRSTVFWVGMGAGALLTVMGIALSGPLADFYGEPAVRGLIAGLSLSFIVTALGATQRALLTREMDFRRLELSTIAGVYAGGAIGVTGASVGWGPWALVAQQLTIAVVSTVFVWLAAPWRPRFVFSNASLRSLGGFGGNVLGTRLTYYAQESALPLIIGRALGSAALGVFTIAYTIVLVPLTRLAIPVGEVLFPAFSQLQHDRERMTEFWLRGLRMLAAFSMPAMAGLIVVAPDLVPVVLGEQWDDAVPVVQILAWVGLLQALSAWSGSILMGLGKANTLFRVSIVFLVLYVLAFLVGVQWGIVGTAAAYAIASTVLETLYLWLTVHALGISFFRPLRALAGVGQAALGMGVAAAVLRAALVEAGVAPALRLAAVIGAGTAIYIALFVWRAPDILAEARGLRRRHGDEAAAPPAVGY
ncbi:MAG: MOP flippase family protein [Actinobacteria bacterium]|nr:MOP flippase family protein [Actinomycetota bacterium]